MAKQKRCICNIFDAIEVACDDILKTKAPYYDSPSDLKRDVDDGIDYILSLVKEARERGQAMEDRLSLYRNAIEDLGYVRDKEDNIKDEINALKDKIFELTNAKQETDHEPTEE